MKKAETIKKSIGSAQFDALINDFLRRHRTDILEDLKELVRIPSVKGAPENGAPFGRETRRALDTAARQMERLGLSVVIPEEGAYGYCDYGSGEQGTVIGIIPHLDVVPAGGAWQYPVYEPTVEDGYIIGRGVSDDKGGAIGSMYALAFLKEAGIPVRNTVRLLFLCNEELDMQGDIDLLRRDGMVPDFSLIPDAFFPVGNGEKGAAIVRMSSRTAWDTVMDFEGGDSSLSSVPFTATCRLPYDDRMEAELEMLCARTAGIEYERTGSEILVRSHGVPAHPVMPESGENAVTLLAKALSGLSRLSDHDRKILSFVAAASDGYRGEGLQIAQADAVSGCLTSVLVHAATDTKHLQLDFYVKHCVTTDTAQLFETIGQTAGDHGFSSEPELIFDAHYISPDDGRIRCLMQSYFASCGQKPELYVHPGNTYAGRIGNAVIYGNEFRAPGPFGCQRGRAHQTDEVTNIDLLMQSVRVYAHALLSLDAYYSPTRD